MTKKITRILLLKDIEKLGQTGTIINVPLGHARNFLIPQGLGCLVTPGIEKTVKDNLAKQTEKNLQIIEEAKNIAQIIETIKTFTIKKKVGKDNLIFGSITNQEVADLVGTKIKNNIDKRSITIPNIKETGVYEIDIKLHSNVNAQISLQILSSDD
nr:ribosomal protein L9 [Erythrocladia irregularis]